MENFVAYPAVYRDQHGSESTIIYNDGRNLTMRVRDVDFSGTSFDDFAPADETNPQDPRTFTLNHNELCDCELSWQMPIVLTTPDGGKLATLECLLKLGKPASNGGIFLESLKITLTYGEMSFSAAPNDFEDVLLKIQRQLPAGYSLRSCITCAFSDYDPLGTRTFGDLACFRNMKDAYRNVKSKHDLFEIWSLQAGKVQETYLCPEYEPRKPNTGYRG